VKQAVAMVIPLAYALGGYTVGMNGLTFLPTFLPVFALCALVAVQEFNAWYAFLAVSPEAEEL
jgi:hypothetical protein